MAQRHLLPVGQHQHQGELADATTHVAHDVEGGVVRPVGVFHDDHDRSP
jgi:hypothetical protein